MLEDGEEGAAPEAAEALEPAAAPAAAAGPDAETDGPDPDTREITVGERFQRLFDELRITKIIFVDDDLEKQLDAAFVVKLLTDIPASADAVQPFFPSIDLSAANDHLFELVDAVLHSLDANARANLSAALVPFNEDAADIDVPQTLRELAPVEFDIDFLTPVAWIARRDELLENCSADARTLFLFDQDLNTDGAGGFTKGTEIIASLAAQDRAAFGTRWFCGILSHTLDKGTEVAKWRELFAEEGLELELFMPISKQNLRDGEAFYGAVYRTVINIYTEKMKGVAKEAFQTALQQALTEFADLDPIGFEHMIVKSSEDEGVSELETLLRLYAIVQKDRVKAELLDHQRLATFLDAARTVKSVVDVARALPDSASKRLGRLRVAEMYEEGSLINRFRDPLRNGDLFETGGPGNALKLWVLIAQPCDLMVRSDGKRAHEDNFKVAVLAPVKRGPLGAPPEVKSGVSFPLERIDHNGTQMGVVQFAEATPVDLCVLDLSVLNAEGKCDFHALKPEDHGAFASLAWDRRALRLGAAYKKIANKIERVRKADGENRAREIAGYVVPPAAPAAHFRNFGNYDEGRFVYKVRRCGRVREPFATSLLAAFSRYLARDAHEHDFSKVRKS